MRPLPDRAPAEPWRGSDDTVDTGRVVWETPQPVYPPAPPLPRVSNAALFTVIALAITLVGLFYLIQTAEVANLGYEVSRLERERAAKSLENQELTYEIARFQALPAIETMARRDLGMTPMEDFRFITVTAPASAELATPAPEPVHQRTRLERIWDRLTGQAEATNAGVSRGGP
jgi:cell division protein FtsB